MMYNKNNRTKVPLKEEIKYCMLKYGKSIDERSNKIKKTILNHPIAVTSIATLGNPVCVASAAIVNKINKTNQSSMQREFNKELEAKNVKIDKQKKIITLLDQQRNNSIDNVNQYNDVNKYLIINSNGSITVDYNKLDSDSMIDACNNIKLYESDFSNQYNLSVFDYSVSVTAGVLGYAFNKFAIGIPEKTKDGLQAGFVENKIRSGIDKLLTPQNIKKLEKKALVPFDAQDNRNTKIPVEGLSAYFHRLHTPGHDPSLFGIIIGIYDIMNGTMTSIDKNGNWVCQVMDNYGNRIVENPFKAIYKEFLHLLSDVNTSMGLPAPFMTLFNLADFGKFGKEQLTIAAVVKSMYAQGYDFIHFAAQSTSVMLTDLIVRICFFFEQIANGYSFEVSIKVAVGKSLCQRRIETMLFLSSTVNSGLNISETILSKKIMNLNYPALLVFSFRALKQGNWIGNKDSSKQNYITNQIRNEKSDVSDDIIEYIVQRNNLDI